MAAAVSSSSLQGHMHTDVGAFLAAAFKAAFPLSEVKYIGALFIPIY